MNNKFKANTALALSAVGAAFTIPTISPIAAIGNFSLGLLNHAFLAATIGGLADWFAVTALFRKPLGISFRTQILIRNRKRIMDAIVEFVSNDLLNTRNIMNTVRDENTAELLIQYFEHNDGRRKIKNIIFELLVEIAADANTQKFSQNVAPLVQKEISSIDPNQIVKFCADVLTKQSHSKKVLTFLCDAAQNIFHSQPVQSAVLQKISNLRQDYVGSSASRALLLSVIDLNDDKILNILNENVDSKIVGTINALKGTNVHPDVTKSTNELVETFNGFVKGVADDSASRNFINGIKSFFTNNLRLAEYIQLWLDKNIKGQTYVDAVSKLNRNAGQSLTVELDCKDIQWRGAVEKLVDSKIDDFIASPMQQDAFDRFVKKSIEDILNSYHDTIPDLINERLNRLDDQQLTEFVESRVADDLQMIRINGAVCGACVGIVLYIVSWLLKF
ncbi:MAG: DUF445 domain-containing protein [Selenomonadaceae bacterium]|nr:DUF445 domain-containing protein [Selenomonadaceae bacterium]